MLGSILGFIVGLVVMAIVWFFVAKNNKKKLLEAFAAVDNLPNQAKSILSKIGINI